MKRSEKFSERYYLLYICEWSFHTEIGCLRPVNTISRLPMLVASDQGAFSFLIWRSILKQRRRLSLRVRNKSHDLLFLNLSLLRSSHRKLAY